MSEDLELLKYPIGKFKKSEVFSRKSIEDAIIILKAFPMWLDASIENLDEYQLNTPYRDGGWTVNQVVHHLADSHINAYIRIKLALTQDTPEVNAYDENKWAVLPDVFALPVNMSTTLIHGLHARMTALMERMTDEDWQRGYYHNGYKRHFALWEVAELYAWHSKHHLAHISSLRGRNHW